MREAIEQFRAAIKAAGLEPPVVILGDGKLHRFSTNGKASDDAGWYILHTDGVPAGAFGCHRQGIDKTWCARKLSDLTASEREQHWREITKTKCLTHAERERTQVKAQERARQFWQDAQNAPAKPSLSHARQHCERSLKRFNAALCARASIKPKRAGLVDMTEPTKCGISACTCRVFHRNAYSPPAANRRCATAALVSCFYHVTERGYNHGNY